MYSGETILLSVFAIYVNTAQSSLRIIGNMTQGESVIGYAFIVDGNSSWQNYSVKITVPNNVSSAFLQLSIGWVISDTEPEVVMLKDLTLYKINTSI